MSPWPHCFWVFGGLFGDGIGVKPGWGEEWGGLILHIFGKHPLGARHVLGTGVQLNKTVGSSCQGGADLLADSKS